MTDYKTVSKLATAEFVEKRSRFISSVSPVQNEEEALRFLAEIKAANREARHNVYAYICRENNICRYSDDGEPGGTAGMPVLHVLQSQGLTDVCVVVTRYFGGILLGAGGLTRAYAKSAADGVSAAGICQMVNSCVFKAEIAYPLLGKVQHVCAESDFSILDTSYDASVTLTLCVETDRGDFLREKLVDATDGKIQIEKKDECFVAKLLEG